MGIVTVLIAKIALNFGTLPACHIAIRAYWTFLAEWARNLRLACSLGEIYLPPLKLLKAVPTERRPFADFAVVHVAFPPVPEAKILRTQRATLRCNGALISGGTSLLGAAGTKSKIENNSSFSIFFEPRQQVVCCPEVVLQNYAYSGIARMFMPCSAHQLSAILHN
jgi:hypothetical protein